MPNPSVSMPLGHALFLAVDLCHLLRCEATSAYKSAFYLQHAPIARAHGKQRCAKRKRRTRNANKRRGHEKRAAQTLQRQGKQR